MVLTAETEIRNQLMEKGYSPMANPDISVYFLVTRDNGSNVDMNNEKLGYKGFRCVHCDLNRMPEGYQDGTLVIHIIDNKTKRLVWRGVDTADLQNMSEEEKLTLLRKYVKQMFAGEPWSNV